MRAHRFVWGFLLASTAALAGCGTIVHGGAQTVDVVVKGSPTASCTFSTSKFRNFGHFPNKVTLERSKENLEADCQGEQNRHIKFTVPTRVTAEGTAGNVPTGVAPGASYDIMTGAMWEYPDPIIVDFREGHSLRPEVAWPENTVDAQVDATRIGTADIAPPRPVRMQPIMDDELNPALPNRNEGARPQVIDAVRIAVDEQKTTPAAQSFTATKSSGVGMKPIASPEDDPAVLKAKQEARAKAEAEAKRKEAEKKAAAAEARRKKAAEKKEAEQKAEAEKAAAEAAKAQSLPETTTDAPPPAATTTPIPEAAPVQAPEPAPQQSAPQPAAQPAPEAAPQAPVTPPANGGAESSGSATVVPLGPTQLSEPEETLPTDADRYLQGN